MTAPTRRLTPLLALLAAAGCGGGPKPPTLTPAQVVVTLNGQPLANARVTLTPTGNYSADAIAVGVTDDAGRATLACNGQPGACVGANAATVTEGPSGDDRERNPDSQVITTPAQRGLKNRPIPTKYAILAQSGLTVDVKAGQAEYKLDLTR